MMVTFVSQCEKKALNKTRRVLDAFANRIGDNTWQTVITNEGLSAVKKLLRKTASKNTAVSCHWIRSRSRSELVWIVGKRSKFNGQGFVPVNSTQKDFLKKYWENDWIYLPLIRALTAIAALFHDWGKSNEFFQNKLIKHAGEIIGDPIRHEWISVLLLVALVNNEDDEKWLSRLEDGLIDESLFNLKNISKTPLNKLPQAASIITWLVLTHHRLPTDKNYENKYGNIANSFDDVFRRISYEWGYSNVHGNFEKDVHRCFKFHKGFPNQSRHWLKEIKRWTRKLKNLLPDLQQSIEDGSFRLVLHHCRLCLMLGDHYYSSLDTNSKERLPYRDLELIANTDNKQPKQSLDEHLIGVKKISLEVVNYLSAFEGTANELDSVHDNTALKKRSSDNNYQWQDKAVDKIIHWRLDQSTHFNPHQYGFFAVNLASTGKGKTFANAKVMRALSYNSKSLRYILALGLRTLTLQTGTEYRERIGLEESDLAILIGSKAIMDLYQKNKTKIEKEQEFDSGSESEESLLDNEIIYDSEIPDDKFATILRTKKHRQLLYASVVACTIDHLMPATETIRGGKYILPALRLMSSDLVIDEIDDFGGLDLIAIGRLIHLAGMLGRKVMISSATIPPDLAEGYFNVYQAGWQLFAKSRNRSLQIGCAWIDEFNTQIETINTDTQEQNQKLYQQLHFEFIKGRIKQLSKQIIKRKADIFPICFPEETEDEVKIQQSYFSDIQQAIIQKHFDNFHIDNKSNKKISFGVVRIANINPCVEITRYLLNAKWPEDIEVRAMAYHSQQILIMRNAQEVHLDEVLKRKSGFQNSFNLPLIRKHINQCKAQNIIFILVATPVEEVGRDHCFDWAVIEPSSYRSIIQLAGRILRHLQIEQDIQRKNISLMQFNLKGLKYKLKGKTGKSPAFIYPGYESDQYKLTTHNLVDLLDTEIIQQKIDAVPRICKTKNLNPETQLADLEHQVISDLLTNYGQVGAETMQAWLTSYWWLTAIPQQLVKFRKSSPQFTMYLYPEEDNSWGFVEKNSKGKATPYRNEMYGIEFDNELTALEQERLWLTRDYEELLEDNKTINLKYTALVYGELNFPVYPGEDKNNLSYCYSSQFGLMRN